MRDGNLHEDALLYLDHCAGVMATLPTAAFTLPRMDGFRSIRTGLQAVIHDISALLAMARGKLEPKLS
ncbi:MAG: hypothetical protein ACKO25_11030 [Cyanobium sp.]